MPGCSARKGSNSWEGFPSSCRRTHRTSWRQPTLPGVAGSGPPPAVVCQQGGHSLARRWRPIPDVVILRGPKRAIGTRLARARDVALLVEVSDTTYAKDSGPKLRRYASFRIPVYWIVDLNRRIVEVRTGPFGRGSRPVIRSATPIAKGTRSRWSWTAKRSGGSRYLTCCRESGIELDRHAIQPSRSGRTWDDDPRDLSDDPAAVPQGDRRRGVRREKR